ncbi:hypothetical protein JCM3775_004540, partial [Rhodotorula graminis]
MPLSGRLALLLLVVALFARASLLHLALVTLALVATVIAVLVAYVSLTRVAEQRIARASAPHRSGSARGGGGARRPAVNGTWAGVPPLHFTSPAAWAMTQTKAAWEAAAAAAPASLDGAPPFLQAALDSLLELVLRDFVRRWYDNLSDSPVFPTAVDRTIRDTLVALSTRVASTLDWSEVLVGRILPLVTAHLEHFRQAHESAHVGAAGDSDEADLFVASRYADLSGARLHPAVDVAGTNSRPAEEAYLRNLFGALLPLVVPEREMDSAAVAVMVREIVSCAVMLPIFELLSDPDFYNRLIDDKAGAAIRDRKMVTEFREALDKQAPALAAVTGLGLSAPPPTTRTAAAAAGRKTEVVTVRTSARQFDAWLANIGALTTLGDARRLRSDVTSQIRRAKLATDGKSLDDMVDGVKVADWIDFIERLYTAKRKIDRRIGKLGGPDSRDRAPSVMSSPASHGQPALRDLLLEPTAVTYLMEFLERRRHSARAQFWLLVEGLKDPLEELDVDLPTTTTSGASTLDDGSIALDDIRMIWDAYLASDPFRSSKVHLETVRSFVAERHDAALSPVVASPHEVRQVRHALFAIQGDVLALLEEEDLPAFRRSDLHFKAVAAMPSSFAPPPPAAYVTPPSPLATRPPRPRSRSNPQVPPLRATTTPTTLVAAAPLGSPTFPPPRPASPALLGQSRTQRPQRTETAPPQVTFHAAAFDRPATRRPDLFDGGGGESPRFNPVRKVSSGSVDTVNSTASAPTATSPTTGGSSARRSRVNLADSLEFLMSPPPEVDRSPLFGAAAADDAADDGAHSDDDYVQVQTIEAIQEALNSILATDARAQPEASRSTTSLASVPQDGSAPTSRRVSADAQRKASLFATETGKSSPSLPTSPAGTTSWGVTSPPALPPRPVRHRGVFDDAETVDDADADQDDVELDFDPHDIVLPAPGDLHLPAEIARLTESLAKLKGQEAVVEALIRKAELTGNASELKLLVKSRDSLRREIRAATFQKDQYEAQASENELTPDRTRVAIPGTTVGQAGGGGAGSGSSSAATALAPTSAQSFQLYLVEVHQLAPDGSFRAGWIVTRRYSEFSALYGKLKDKYVAARYLDFPSKRLVGIWSKEFIEQRREGLERYLQALIRIPVICRSSELRAFLSQQTIALPKSDVARKLAAPLLPGQALRSLYRGFTSGIDDVLGTSTTSMVDTIVARLGQQAAEFAGTSTGGGAGKVNDEDLVDQLVGSDATAPAASAPDGEALTYFTSPFCDLVVSIFGLKDNWLRRQAILIVLQQVLGGTIER